jgi:hypothetical protein
VKNCHCGKNIKNSNNCKTKSLQANDLVSWREYLKIVGIQMPDILNKIFSAIKYILEYIKNKKLA